MQVIPHSSKGGIFMKRKLALITAVSIMATAFSAFNAGAASYTVGTRQDFESAFSTGTDKIVQVNDEKYGNVLKFSPGGQIAFDFSELTSGTYRISFDLNMSSTESTPFDIYTKTPKVDNSGWQQMSFMRLNSGVVGTLANNTGNGAQIGTATYAANTWQRYDIVMPLGFEDDRYADVYIDGVKKGEIDLNNNSVYGMKFILFLFSDWRGDKSTQVYALLDNLEVKQVSATAEMTASRGFNGDFTVEFSETMNTVNASDIILTRKADESSDAEAVDFTIKYSTPTKTVITPASKDGGYIYTVSVADGLKTAFNNPVSGSYSVNVGETVNIDKKWDFEDGSNPVGGNTEIVDDGYRGKVLKYTASADGNFKMGVGLSSGKYLYSYDLKRDSISDASYMLIRAYYDYTESSEKWKNFEALWNDSNKSFGEFTSSDKVDEPGSEGSFDHKAFKSTADSTWYRIDNVIDMDSKVAYAYCDGEYLGIIDLGARGINTLKGFMMSVTGKNCYYDNIRIKSLSDSYDASLIYDGDSNCLIVDLDETTPSLTAEQFTLTRTSGSFGSTEKIEVSDSDITYQSGTRMVIQLLDMPSDGDIFSIEFDGVKSFIGTPVVPSASYVYEENVSERTETMSDTLDSFTTENVFASDSPWRSNAANGVVTAADGAVTLKQKEGYSGANILYYNFDTVSGGIIEMETTINATTAGSGEYVRIMFRDQDNKEYYIGTIKTDKTQYHASSSSSSKSWNGAESPYKQGTDITMKIKIDCATKKAEFYQDGVLVKSNVYPFWEGSTTADNITGTRAFLFFINQAETSLTVKDVKVTHTYTPVSVGAVSFADANGNNYATDAVSSAASIMKISYPQGMMNDTFNGTVNVTCGGETVSYTGSWDSTTNVYSVKFDELLGASKTYDIALSGSVGKNGEIYNNASGSVTTLNDEVLSVSTPVVTKTDSGVEVKLNALNTKADKTYMMIYAGYNGNRLTYVDYQDLTMVKDANPEKTLTFTDANIDTYDKVTVFVWETFENMTPVTTAVTK
jgi:hypothetical protein